MTLKAIHAFDVYEEYIQTADDDLAQVYRKSEADREIRRQKRKRCLNNAWWCLREEFYAEDCHCERWVDWAIKWYKRWLELADKFKEGV